MADREDQVYQAKLAEQAERYDGMYDVMTFFCQWLVVAIFFYVELCTFHIRFVVRNLWLVTKTIQVPKLHHELHNCFLFFIATFIDLNQCYLLA